MTQFAFYGFSLLLLMGAVNVVLARSPVHSVLGLIFVFFNAAGLFVILGAEFIAMTLVIVYVGAVAVLFLFVVMMMNVSWDYQRVTFSRVYLQRSLVSLVFLIKSVALFSIIFLILVCTPVLVDLYQDNLLFPNSFSQLLNSIYHSKWWIFNPAALKVPTAVIAFIALCTGLVTCHKFIKKPFYNATANFADSIIFFIILGLIFTAYFVTLGASWHVMPSAREIINSPVPPLDLMSNTHALGQVLYVDYVLAFQCAGIILLVGMIGAIVLTLRTHQKSKRQDPHVQAQRCAKNTIELKHIALGSGLSSTLR